MKGIDEEEIIVTSLMETYNFIYQIPNVIRGSLTRDSGVECRLSCSNKGVKVIANVQYKQNDQICSAVIIKPARVEHRINLKKIVCN
jgi:hypothetical protein